MAAPAGRLSRLGHRLRQWRRGLDEAPLRIKLTLLIASAVVWGAVIGIIEAQLGYRYWVLVLGVGVIVLALVNVAMSWIWQPIEKLLDRAQRIARPDRPIPARALPVDRRDEIGQLARALAKLNQTARREQFEARRLRRSLDDEVETATRKATRELSNLAMRDPLTDLANRRMLDRSAEALVQSCRSSGDDLVCVAVDLDNFKAVNDTLGHQAGDELLIFAARLLRAMVRGDDLVARTGGDEFLIFMPGANTQRANQFVDQARRLFHEHARTTLPPEMNVGMSLGAVSLRLTGAPNLSQLIAAADKRLYERKTQSKQARSSE